VLSTFAYNFNLRRYTVVPAAATMYCMGVEAYTSEVNGFDMSAFNKYRWDKTYEAGYGSLNENRHSTDCASPAPPPPRIVRTHERRLPCTLVMRALPISVRVLVVNDPPTRRRA